MLKKRPGAEVLWVLIFVTVFNIVAFLIIKSYHDIFWMTYAFIHFACVMVLISKALGSKYQKTIFLGQPMVNISLVYLLCELCMGTLVMLFGNINPAAAFIIQLVMAALFTFVFMVTFIAGGETMKVQRKRQVEIYFIRTAALELQKMVEHPQLEHEMKKRIERICDLFQSSQTPSHPSLKQMENDLLQNVWDLKYQIDTNNMNSANSVLDTLGQRLLERNYRLSNLYNAKLK